jgi:DeoR family transcriptional regulator of aga operon
VPIDVKQTLHRAEKVRIATAATGLIRDGATLILDSGTTTAEIARQIRGLRLRSINVVPMLSTSRCCWPMHACQPDHAGRCPAREVPGRLRAAGPKTPCGICRRTCSSGVDSLDPEIGLMTPHVLEAQLNAQMIRIARTVVAVTDSSNLRRNPP